MVLTNNLDRYSLPDNRRNGRSKWLGETQIPHTSLYAGLLKFSVSFHVLLQHDIALTT